MQSQAPAKGPNWSIKRRIPSGRRMMRRYLGVRVRARLRVRSSRPDRCEALGQTVPLSPSGPLLDPLNRFWTCMRVGMPTRNERATAGGWRDERTILTSCQQEDATTVRQVVLRPAQRLFGNWTHNTPHHTVPARGKAPQQKCDGAVALPRGADPDRTGDPLPARHSLKIPRIPHVVEPTRCPGHRR